MSPLIYPLITVFIVSVVIYYFVILMIFLGDLSTMRYDYKNELLKDLFIPFRKWIKYVIRKWKELS